MRRLSTGSKDLDLIMGGGLPIGSLVVLAGAPGTGKSILAQQMCFTNAANGGKAIYYSTLSESHSKVLNYLEQFSFFDSNAIGNGVRLNSLSSMLDDGLSAVATEILRAAREEEASFVVVDSAKVIRGSADKDVFRRFMYEVASLFAHTESVLLFVGEYTTQELESSTEFSIADGIVQLANEPKGAFDERWLRVLKMRGSAHLGGRHSLEIGSDGIRVFPRLEATATVNAPAAQRRTSIGVPELDELMGGGMREGDTTLVMGPSGAGKTTLALRFIAQGLSQGERCLYLSFQENEDQLALKADSFGWEFNSARKDGRLTLSHLAPVELNLDRVSELVRTELASGPTRRVVIDSLAELEFAASHTTRLPAYTWKLAKLIRSAGASLIITNEAASLGLPLAGSVSEHAFLFHNVLLLRYFELESEMRRALHVLKMRDSAHDKAALQFEVDEAGFHILQRLESVEGVLG